ncbi:CPBP family intramembrane metalloprotease SdpA [Urechidicola sp. KH5]
MDKKINISPYLSIFGITLLFLVLSGVTMALTLLFENETVRSVIDLFQVILFIFLTYYLSNLYFRKINLIPPEKLILNSPLIIKVLIGFALALIILYPTRISKFLDTDNIEYLFVGFTLKNFAMAFGASVTEEIIFRGTLLNFFNQKNKKYIGLLISSLMFSFIHLSNTIMGQDISSFNIIFFVMMGVCLGLTYLNFGLVSAIALHFLNNFLISGFIHKIGGGYYVLAIISILSIWLFIRDRRKQRK